MKPPSTAGTLACLAILQVVVALLIAARLNLRIRIQRQSLALSDALLLIAWAGAFTHAIFIIILAREDVLRPEIAYTLVNWDVPLTRVEDVTRIIWASVLPFFTALYFCKFALLATYWQLFPPFMRKLRIALYIIIAYCISGYIISMTTKIFLCWPIQGNWSFASDPAALCSSKIIVQVFCIAWGLHFSSNLSIMILPFFVLRGLQMKRKTMYGIYATFGLGFFDIAFSLMRFFSVHFPLGKIKHLTTIELWSILDENVALIIACLPSLRHYLRHGFRILSHDSSYLQGGRSPASNTPMQRIHAPGRAERSQENTQTDGDITGNRDIEEDGWLDGKKTHRSEVEWVRIQAQSSSNVSGLHPGQIRVEQEFIITRNSEDTWR